MIIESWFRQVTEIVTAFGKTGLPAEKVAAQAARDMRNYLRSDAPVGEYLADQLFLPLSMAVTQTGKPHRFRATTCSSHAATQMKNVSRFLPVAFLTEPQADKSVVVKIDSAV